MQPLVSIIVPVWNAGEHLRPCIESILHQTYSNFELIAVLDCPTDGSDNVMDTFAASDKRIHIIRNRTNLHIGQSRNKGLQEAKGKYILFVDHDDECAPTLLESLVQAAQDEATDMVISPVWTTNEQDPTNHLTMPTITDGVEARHWALSEALSGGKSPLGTLVTPILGVLLKKSLLQGLCFVDTKWMSAEDLLFLIEALHKAQKVSLITPFLYTHNEYEQSTGKQKSYLGVEHRERALHYLEERVKEWEDQVYWLPYLRKGLRKQRLRLGKKHYLLLKKQLFCKKVKDLFAYLKKNL